MKRGFSLIELLIVIIIISIVYSLGFDGIEIGKSKPKALTPLNLAQNIRASKNFNSQATLLCVEDCGTCYMRSSISSAFVEYDSPIKLKNIEAYMVDSSDNIQKIDYKRYKDKKICLKMDFYANGSSTQIILKDDKKSYFLPSLFGEPKEFVELDDAKDYWLKTSMLLSDNGAFY